MISIQYIVEYICTVLYCTVCVASAEPLAAGGGGAYCSHSVVQGPTGSRSSVREGALPPTGDTRGPYHQQGTQWGLTTNR